MWIVRLALRRPYTFVVFALLILILGVFSIKTMPTDIFPNIDIPVVTVVWNFNGLSAQEMSTRIVSNSERGITTTVNDVEHIESQSFNGVAIIKIFFQPKANIGVAVSQVTAINQVLLRSLPPGTTPPFIIQYNASSVPVLQLGLSGEGLDEQRLYDLGTNTIRTQLATVEGAQTPFPYGGKQRQIQVDLDLAALQAKGLSPVDVVNAVSAQNLIAPSGTMKIDRFEYAVETNSAPALINDLNNLPIKAVNGAVIYIRDVAHVRDGCPPQTNIVRVDGKRAILMNVLKTGSASTLDIITGVRAKLAYIKDQLPPQLQINALSDQSIFVRGAIERRGPRGHRRRLPHRHHDPGLPRQLALHNHHRDLHSALHSLLAQRPRHAPRDHQHHDPRRLCAGRRHPRRRRDRRHRKHQSKFGSRQGTRTVHPRRLGADRRSGSRLHPRHLHRLRAHVLPERRGALLVCPHGRGRGLCHARQLSALPYAGPHHGKISAQRAR